MDPSHPTERLRFMLSDARVAVLITQAPLGARLEVPAGTVLVRLDADGAAIVQQPATDPSPLTGPDQLAYVLYTSGSTGRPKGVMIQHRSIVNYVLYAADHFGIGPSDRVLQFHSLTVDTHAEEVFPCLARGATLVIRPEGMIDSTTAFVGGCAELGITVVDLPTGYWHELTVGFDQEAVTLPPRVRLVIIAGEKALPDRLARWQRQVGRRVRLANTYGPTETTIVATVCDLPEPGWAPSDGRDLPIGRPLANVKAYVLDPHMNPVPVGTPGQLHVGGANLARGYLGRPRLTAERFVPNPFVDGQERTGAPQTRLYRTGDMVRYRADGTIEFIGRVDHQVKVRGFRIEPGEVEAATACHPAVQDVVVVADDRIPNDTRLTAYIVTAPGQPTPTVPELREVAGARLPGYMIPAAFVAVEGLPRSPAGKVDRRALPSPDRARIDLGREYVAPRNPVEQALTRIWSELLGVQRVGVHDDFFDLGGHSMLGVQLLFRTRKELGVELPLFSVFQHPTIAGLAEIIARRMREDKGRQIPDAEELLSRIDELSQEEVDRLLELLSSGGGDGRHA
jgi:amino acid adenylation domain-containing protein